MGKVKSSDTLSLKKSDQKKVVKQTRQLKKKIQDGKVLLKKPRRSIKDNVEQTRGLIYIGHIPHGFYENEMKKYFKQFGGVTNVKVCRSNKSGNSKGFGYVEFAHPEVAKIAAETMNNYLMFKKRIVAEYVPSEKRPKCLFKGRSSTIKRYSSKVKTEKQRIATEKVDERGHLKRSSVRMSRLNKKLQRLKNAGIDYNFIPVDVPENIKKEKVSTSTKEVEYTFEQDPYDSDIEVKVPVKSSVKTPKKQASKTTPKKQSPKTSSKKTSKNSVSKQSPKKTLKQKLVTRKST
ncbi:MKI67 FHA domain-interacting nucleolar phosphoprotein-like [Anoplophora glabripennis]|uniref:MKI67 FHA domain-interacting nucleolar phosphoprotein-like n=1 Tax=Anoplophora glabripennis TaxID=217634 RepID=UPI0008735A82|nr:MKI67 FHA domain-interacting nucleolar phosphoprotein-like [Anoplophora glabripennis]